MQKKINHNKELSTLMQQALFDELMPPSLIINERLEILQFYGELKPFLELPEQPVNQMLFDFIPPELQVELQELITRCQQDRQPVISNYRTARITEQWHNVRLRIAAIDMSGLSLILISFLSTPITKTKIAQSVLSEKDQADGNPSSPRHGFVENRGHMNAIAHELQSKSAQLQAAATELANVKESLTFPLLVVDKRLRITHANTIASSLLISTDEVLEGRHLSELPFRINMQDLTADVEHVIETEYQKKSIISCEDTIYEMRIMPCRIETGPILGAVIVFDNITTRHHAESALRESEQRLRLTLASIKDYAITTLDLQGRIMSWNNGAYLIHGYTQDEILGQDFTLFFTQDDLDEGKAQALLEQAKKNGRAEDKGWRLKKDGGRFLADVVLSSIVDEEENQISLTLITRDITERVRTETMLKRDQEQQTVLRLIMQEMFEGNTIEYTLKKSLEHVLSLSWLGFKPKGGIMLTAEDDNSLYLAVNHELAPEVESLCAQVPFGHCHCGQAAATCQLQFSQCVDNHQQNTYPCMADHGHYSVPLLCEGKLCGVMLLYLKVGLEREPDRETFLGIVADSLAGYIHRKQAEQGLHNNQQRLQTLLDTASDGVHILDKQGNVVECGESFAQMLGYSLNEALRLNVTDWDTQFLPHQLPSLVQKLMQHPATFKTTHRRKDGSVFEVEINAKGIEIDGQLYLYASSRDISWRKELEVELINVRNRLSVIVETIPDPIWLKDTTGAYLSCNPEFELLLGASQDEIVGKTDYEFLPKSRADFFREKDKIALAAGGLSINEGELTYQSDGRKVVLETRKVPVQGADGETIGILGIGRDITERKLAELEQRQAASVFDNTLDGILIVDEMGLVVRANPAFTLLTGYHADETQGQKAVKFRAEHPSNTSFVQIIRGLKKKGNWQGESWVQLKNGDIKPVRMSVSIIYSEAKKVDRYIIILHDITEQKAAEQHIKQLAHHDSLTGLPNRVLLSDRLQQAMAATRRSQHLLAVCYLDLDGFKPVNDCYGHASGDFLLIEVARRLKGTVRESDTVARIGGDEFVVLLNDQHDLAECELALQRIQNSITDDYPITDSASARIATSIGYTLYPEDDSDAEILLRHADEAMYAVKRSGRGHYLRYSADDDTGALAQM